MPGLCVNELKQLGPAVPERRLNCARIAAMTRHTILLQPAGLAFEAEAGTSILHAAEAAGIDLPSSCRNGTCRTCICRVRSGTAAHLIEWPGLSFDEKREGWILPCVAVAGGPHEIEAPRARRLAGGGD